MLSNLNEFPGTRENKGRRRARRKLEGRSVCFPRADREGLTRHNESWRKNNNISLIISEGSTKKRRRRRSNWHKREKREEGDGIDPWQASAGLSSPSSAEPDNPTDSVGATSRYKPERKRDGCHRYGHAGPASPTAEGVSKHIQWPSHFNFLLRSIGGTERRYWRISSVILIDWTFFFSLESPVVR